MTSVLYSRKVKKKGHGSDEFRVSGIRNMLINRILCEMSVCRGVSSVSTSLPGGTQSLVEILHTALQHLPLREGVLIYTKCRVCSKVCMHYS